ncbi:hypothetical protein [Mycobacterium sp. IDR2000157661]|uniref:hypothetical protein n=1 Tax=Mycobacterium sp. IDR2000157661 TaxID=2867005 RepID=UPI001EEEFC59|nr:hypothetical protein [Mycobacterium sp. IDR2000157661]
MVVTIGLQRLEAGLHRDTVSAGDVAKFFEHAEPSDVSTLARDGMSRALDGLRQRQHARDAAPPPAARGSGLPTLVYAHHGANTEFRPTRHADRV